MNNTAAQVQHQRTVQAVMDKAVEGPYAGMIVCVNGPDGSRSYAAGWMDREKGLPARPDALFKIASISKLYIAAATTKLICMDSLDLEDTLTELIPEVQGRIDKADQITLGMMLQHRSGIPEYIFHPDFAGSDPNLDYMQTIALLYDQPADFHPDKKYKYSNSNYLLIGEILDRTLGYSHHDFIQSQILDPLNLKNTHSLSTSIAPEALMSGYYVGDPTDYKLEEIHSRPGGSMVATA